MLLEFMQLEEVIRHTAGNRPIYFMANQGNWGDGLIRLGTLAFFKHTRLNYREIRPGYHHRILPLLRGGTLLYGGSGAWSRDYQFADRSVSKYHKRFNVIVLPSTYEVAKRYPGVTYFARDHYESLQTIPDALFCHDMAFFLKRLQAPAGRGVGYFFRTDPESAGGFVLPPNNRDLSEEGNQDSDMYPFFRALSQYEVVLTDRLHVAIGAALINRRVHLFGNRYFKIQAIYRSSIQPFYDNVTFHQGHDWQSVTSPKPDRIVSVPGKFATLAIHRRGQGLLETARH